MLMVFIEKCVINKHFEGFLEIFKQKRGAGRVSLRRHGFEMAKTNPSVHIFYAKNFLGMTDKVEQTVVEVEDLTSLAEMLRDDPGKLPSIADETEENEDGQRTE